MARDTVLHVKSDISHLAMFDCFSLNFLGLLSNLIPFAEALICYKNTVAFYMKSLHGHGHYLILY